MKIEQETATTTGSAGPSADSTPKETTTLQVTITSKDEIAAPKEKTAATPGGKGKSSVPAATTKKKRKHKPEDFPKRPLSAYNIFFKEARESLLSGKEIDEPPPTPPPPPQEGVQPKGEGGDNAEDGENTTNTNNHLKSSMVKRIAAMWKSADVKARERVEQMAKVDMQRYKDEVQAYEEDLVIRTKRQREENQRQKQQQQQSEKERKEREEKKEASKLDDSTGSSSRRSVGQFGRDSSVEERGGARFQTPALDGSMKGSEEEMQMLLADETSALEMAESFKARQLSLARRLQTANPQSGILASLERKRASLGLSPLVVVREERHERDMVSRGGPLGGGGRRLSPLGSGRPIMGMKPFVDQDFGLPPRDYSMVPHPRNEASMQLDSLRFRQDEAMLRLKRLREQELMSLQSHHHMHQDATFSELAAQRQKLLEKERSVSRMMEHMDGAPSYHPFPPGAGFRPRTGFGGIAPPHGYGRHPADSVLSSAAAGSN